jgi:hypothetical protein
MGSAHLVNKSSSYRRMVTTRPQSKNSYIYKFYAGMLLHRKKKNKYQYGRREHGKSSFLVAQDGGKARKIRAIRS